MKLFGTLILLSVFFSGALAQNDSVKADTTAVYVHEKVDIEAMIVDGESTWRRYLETYMNVMVPYNNGAPIGKYTVIVQFIVDVKGNVSDVKALTNFGYGMEEEATRLLKNGPKWIPAMLDGKYVKAYRKQPITFIVLGDGIEINSDTPYVLYSGIENLLEIKVDNMSEDQIHVTISQGNIVSIGNWKYKVSVNNSGNAIITVFSSKEQNKILGSAYFIVKKKNN